jgi:hypothetical protein
MGGRGGASHLGTVGKIVRRGDRGRGVTGFSAEWLALREPYDLSARNPAVLAALAAHVADLAYIRVVDLACGTGATMRAISSRLPPKQSWRRVDNDESLLTRAASSFDAKMQVDLLPNDISRDLEAALAPPLDLAATSALLDLVSEDWLRRFASAIAARGLRVYAALTFDGRIGFEPADAFDAEIIAAVNRHQRGDKGFGSALGPAAGSAAIACFESLGYVVTSGNSDWLLGPNDREMQSALAAGWAFAARETGALRPADIEAWLVRRLETIAAGRSSIAVGHVDFFGRPIKAR